MVFNPSPKVAAARDFGNKFKKEMVIIISISGNEIEYASYGKTPALCTKARKVADHAFETILRGFGEMP